MSDLIVAVLTIYLQSIQSENISLNPGDENMYSILPGDTLTLLCPVNSTKKGDVRWSYVTDTVPFILSIGEKLQSADFRFSVAYKNHLKEVLYLRIYNITSEEQRTYKCYYPVESCKNVSEYKYDIQLDFTNSLIKKQSGRVCCLVHGRNIKAVNYIWEQRTLLGEHVRFIESVKKNYSEASELVCVATRKHYHLMSCLNFNINQNLTYDREGEYICIAEVFIERRNQSIKKTSSFEIENIQDRPICVQETRTQRSILGTNIRIGLNFYSKPKYSALFLSKNISELKFGGNFTVSITNISLDVYNVTVIVSGYEIIINITEFSEEDIGNYTVDITNGFGYSNCTVQLLSLGNGYPQNNQTEKVVIGNTKRTEETKPLQWYIVACGSIIVVLLAMSALRSTFLKTVNTCSEPTSWNPCCHKSTEKQATRKQRRAYSDHFTEVTLNQLHNGERVLIIGQTNEMNASTESNI